MSIVTNIAAYKFAPLGGLKPLRERLLGLCKGWGLKGTILLSTEGVNLFVAGARAQVEMLLAELRGIPGLENLTAKVSETEHQPFSRMLVRIKKEIIAFGVDGIDPARDPAPKLDPRTLKQWLDEKRPLTLLDTRNDYEVKLGTFAGAQALGIEHFRDFPDAVQRLPVAMKDEPVVMFCTGGIRCEKAGPFMQREGFRNVFQLDGGILKYFEQCGGAHYEGECFVFDQRVGVDARLHETDSAQCHACQTPLTADEQKDARYIAGESCPYCFKSNAEQMAENIAHRHEAIRRATSPLPGSQPYENHRPVTVPAKCDHATMLDFLCTILGHVPRAEWLAQCNAGRFLDRNGAPVSAEHRVRAGERYLHTFPAEPEPDVCADIRILHEDEAIIVLEKPAPLPVHAGGRFHRNTLQHILHAAYAPEKPRPAHRLDANTTGLVIVARTRHFAGLLQPQFSRGEVEKVYLARVHGHPASEVFSCDLPVSDEPGAHGSREVDAATGRAARTEFRVLRREADGTALIEARPLTGRTNQIRVHLWKLDLPICGDPLYLAGQKLGRTQTLSPADPPLHLHAWRLTFTHPLKQKRVTFEAARPDWA